MLDARFDKQLGTFHLDMHLRSESGRTTVVLGESGSGKSLILKHLAGLMQPDHGHFVLDDELYVDTEQHFEVRAHERPIGYVFQDYVLFPHLSVYDNVAFGLRMQKLDRKLIHRRVAESLERVHLVGYDDRHPGQLSGGQQQRVAIARALALEPRLLLLDESLSALDIQTRREVQQELVQILSDNDLTAVMVSHQYEDALVFGDQIVVMERGRVIQAGRHADLLQRPQSPYIAEMVGINFFRGRVVAEDAPGEYAIELAASGAASLSLRAAGQGDSAAAARLRPGDEVSVVFDPSTVEVHTSEPPAARRNVFRGEIAKVVPVSAAYSPTARAIEGLMRVSLVIDPDLPPLTADVDATRDTGSELRPGATAWASFEARATRAYVEDARVPSRS